MNLREAQSAFWKATVEGQTAPPELFVSSTLLPSEKRVEIYASMYLWRLMDALRQDYPKVASLLGDYNFNRLCKLYVTAHPSTAASLAALGGGLAEMLRSQTEFRADAEDLAELEWARAEAFVASDSNAVAMTAFADAGSTLPACTLSFQPSLRILRLSHRVLALWKSLEEDSSLSSEILTTDQAVSVWRNGFSVYHAALSPAEEKALEKALAGGTIADVCSSFGNPQEAFEILSSWLSEGWITALTCCDLQTGS